MSHGEFIFGRSGLADFRSRVGMGGCVLTIGSFDGVHLGHQALLASAKQRAKVLGLPSVVMIFEPQPYEYFHRGESPARLMRLREKVMALLQQGVDHVLCLKFNAAFRSLSAIDFIEQVLVGELAIKHLQVGDDFRFGCDRAGDFALLQSEGKRHGFSVSSARTLQRDGRRVSSTWVRELLAGGELDKASQLLNKPFALTGRVGFGKQLGRSINVPTANIILARKRAPINGVFAVKAQILSGEFSAVNSQEEFCGVANVGFKPTLGLSKQKPLLEVHLFNFNGDLYGQWLQVEFLHKIREERKFESFDALKDQISVDIQASKTFFNRKEVHQ